MRNGTPGFQTTRLVEARDSRGLSQVALAELINRTSSSISRWEAGGQSPEPEALDALARTLNLPVAFFMRSQPDHGSGPKFFRSMANTTQSLRRRAYARLRWAQDISLVVQEWLELPPVDVPRLEVRDYREIRDEDIERMANACRQAWGLATAPIADVLLVLENAGIVVAKEEIGSASMDGLSNWSSADNRPYVLLARDKDVCVRSRLDAAHELGHLVLHSNINDRALHDSAAFKEIERQAFLFAGAFLLPAESFGAEVWSPSLNTFLALKERWKASIGAMIMRCRGLNLTSEEYEQRLWKHYGGRGWRKSEPLDDKLTPEMPRLLSRSVRLLVDEGIRSRQELLDDFRFSATDVESLCGLPRGYMTSQDADVVSMPRIKPKESAETVSANATVLSFRRR